MCTPHRARAPTRSLEARTRAVVVLVSVLGPFVPVWNGAGGNSHEELRGGSPGMPSLPTRPIPARTHESGGNYHGNHGGSTRAFLRVWNGIRAGSTPTRTPRVSRGWGGESGPAAGPGKSSRISAGNRRVSWGGIRGWQHEERYRTRGGELRTSLSRSGGHKGYRPAFPRLLYAFPLSNPHAMQVFLTARRIFFHVRIANGWGIAGNKIRARGRNHERDY